MITTQNYFEEIEKIKFSSLPKKLKEGYDFTHELTEEHSSWKYYKSDKDLRAIVDEYLAALNEYVGEKSSAVKKTTKNPDEEQEAWRAAKDLIYTYVERGDSEESLRKGAMGSYNGKYHAEIKGHKIHVSDLKNKKVDYSFPLHSVYSTLLHLDKVREGKQKNKEEKPEKKASHKHESKPRPLPQNSHRVRITTKDAKPIERIDDEVRFIKRFTIMHGKVKTDMQVLNFINALQRAIVERRIRKTSPYAKEIEFMQAALVQMYRTMKKEVKVHIDEKTLDKFVAISGSEKVRLSINYMKRFIGMQGKHIDKEKAQRLFYLVQNAIEKNKIKPNDPYMARIKTVLNSLKFFTEVAKKGETLKIHEAVLNGISQALACECCEKKKDVLSGVEEVREYEEHEEREEHENNPSSKIPSSSIINSMDFCEMKFDKLGFMGKWKEFIGDPSPGFSAMIFGKPKFGKSILAIDFAGYLARHHGNVLYVAKEEGLDTTLQEKFNEMDVKHPCLTVTGELPQNLAPYDFIFLDSINTLGISPNALTELKKANPDKSFIPVHQTTKTGNFRGDNRFQHNVDVVIEMPEKGKAIQYGRFNQGGEMQIF